MTNRINALVDCLIDDPVWLILIGTVHFVIALVVFKLVDLADHQLVGWLLLPGVWQWDLGHGCLIGQTTHKTDCKYRESVSEMDARLLASTSDRKPGYQYL